MEQEYKKISLLKTRNTITTSDLAFIKAMHEKYCGYLKKKLCWGCPSSIREAIFDLTNYIEKNPIDGEENKASENSKEQSGSSISGIPDQQLSPKKRGRRPKSSTE